MAKRAKASKEVMRTIRLKFLTDTGKTHTISLDYASAELAGADAPMLVKKVMEMILEYDVFTVKLVKAIGAELVERRVLLMDDDLRLDELHMEAEAGLEAQRDEKTGGAGAFKMAAVTRQVQGMEQGSRVKCAVLSAASNDESGRCCDDLSCHLPVGGLSHTVVEKEPGAVDSAASTRSPPF